MAKSTSAERALKQSEKHAERNRAIRSSAKSAVKKAEEAISKDPAAAGDKVKDAVSTLDRTAKKGIYHPNKTSRKKSRLVRKLNAAAAKPAKA